MTKYPKARPKAMTVTSRAPYFDFGVNVDAELELTFAGALEVVLGIEVVEPEVVVAADPEPVAVDKVVAAVELLLLAPVDDVTVALDEEPVDWAN